jgi:hypothetical protein
MLYCCHLSMNGSINVNKVIIIIIIKIKKITKIKTQVMKLRNKADRQFYIYLEKKRIKKPTTFLGPKRLILLHDIIGLKKKRRR